MFLDEITTEEFFATDNDNFLDICLELEDEEEHLAKKLFFTCDENTQVYPPKGPSFGACVSSVHEL